MPADLDQCLFEALHEGSRTEAFPDCLRVTCRHRVVLVYPVALIACLWGSIRLLRRDRVTPALWISLIPLAVFGLLVLTYVTGGIVLR